MTLEDKITALRSMMGESDDSDVVLTVYLDLAKHKILNRMYQFPDDYAYNDDMDIPDRYASIQLNIACYMLNKRGAEGEIQHIENGIHRNYGSSEVPDSMLKDVIPFARVIR